MIETQNARVSDLTLEGVLAPGGSLAGLLQNYEHRPQQLKLAQAINQSLVSRQILLAEAGTGTGKTLAYLVPAWLSGKRVVISTATKNLQDQIFFKDIPLLRRGVDAEISAALLKGRSNYVCLARYEQFCKAPTFASPADVRVWEQFRVWVSSTDTGDRSMSSVPDHWEAWNRVSTNSDNCTGSACSFYDACFVTRARRLAEESKLIIVNHALFFADLSLRMRGDDEGLRVLPRYDAVIFDEAHALEDVATDYFGYSISNSRLAAITHAALQAHDAADDTATILLGLSSTLRTRSEALFAQVERIGTHPKLRRDERSTQIVLTPELVETFRPAVAPVIEVLSAISSRCSINHETLGPLHRMATDAAHALDEITRCDDRSRAYWLEIRATHQTLRSAPVEIGQSLAKHLYRSVESVILTSATLKARQASGSPFEFTLHRLGLGADDCTTFEVDSPFDYARQAALYIPQHLPEPSSQNWTLHFAREVFQLIKLSEGRAFVLFTSLKHMREVYALVAPHLTYQVLMQGDAPRKELIETFRIRSSVLFASQSFWEGVDVPGDALSLVIIDRLPFAPPNDPLQAARMKAIADRGGSPFDDYQLPQAALSLRQGFGRLIRTASDRGIVALGDVRVVRRRYGDAFFKSLPPAQRFMTLKSLQSWWTDAPEIDDVDSNTML